MTSLTQQLDRARTHHHAGQFETAASLYEEILTAQPQHAEALFLLGALHCQCGQYVSASRHLQQALSLHPEQASGHNNLGFALQHQGQLDAAVEQYEEAVALKPNYVEAHYNLGNALRQQGKLNAASASYACAIALRPNFAPAHNNLGVVYREQGKTEAAVASLTRATALQANYAEAHNNLGVTQKERGDITAAVASYEQAIVLRPDYAEAHNNLGVALRDQGHLDPALYHFQQALTLAPGFADAHYNLGVAYQQQGNLTAAREHYDQTVSLRPEHAEAHWNRAFIHLAQGNLGLGWADYEWRVQVGELPSRGFPQPRWDGTSLAGRTILVHAEQGVGDELLFASCLPDVLAQAERVVLDCDLRLAALFARSFPTASVHGAQRRDDLSWLARFPGIDVYSPIGSLPRYLRPTISRFPQHTGYLVPDATQRTHWQARLAALGPGLKIGIAWRSRIDRHNPSHYTRLEQWGPILTQPGVHFVNLQYDAPAAELSAAQQQHSIPIQSWTDLDLFNDFDGVAALIAALDLVITPETTVAQLAGGVGQRVWQLMTFGGSWPMLGTAASPWFPSLRVFMQPQRGEWYRVVQQIAAELAHLAPPHLSQG